VGDTGALFSKPEKGGEVSVREARKANDPDLANSNTNGLKPGGMGRATGGGCWRGGCLEKGWTQTGGKNSLKPLARKTFQPQSRGK